MTAFSTGNTPARNATPRQLFMYEPTLRIHDPSSVLTLESTIEDAITMAATSALAFAPFATLAAAFVSAATSALAFAGGKLFTDVWTAAATAAFVIAQGSNYSEATTMAATAALAVIAFPNFLASATMAATAALALAGTPNYLGAVALNSQAAFTTSALGLLINSVALAANAALAISTGVASGDFAMTSLARLQLYGYVGIIPVDLVIRHAAIASPGLRGPAVNRPYLTDIQLPSPALRHAQVGPITIDLVFGEGVGTGNVGGEARFSFFITRAEDLSLSGSLTFTDITAGIDQTSSSIAVVDTSIAGELTITGIMGGMGFTFIVDADSYSIDTGVYANSQPEYVGSFSINGFD